MERSLHIQLSEEGADAERLDTLTRYLRQELRDLNVADVRPLPAGEAPSGSRAFDVMAVGGLMISWVSSDALRSVVSTIRNWLSRGHAATHSVRLEIDGDVLNLSAASTAEQERLIDLFVTRHGAGKDQAWAANERP
jgi:hypothetical protein